MIKGIDRVPIVSLYSLFQYSKRFHFALSFLSRKLYYIQFFPSYSHITCPFLAIKITALQPSTPFFHKPRETIIFIPFYLRHRFVSFSIAPLISRLIFVLQNFGFSFQWRLPTSPSSLIWTTDRHCCFHRIFTSSLPFNFLKLGRKKFLHANRFNYNFNYHCNGIFLAFFCQNISLK